MKKTWIKFSCVAALIATTPVAGFSNSVSPQSVVSVYERERPDYDAQGVRAGSFKILPKVGLSFESDDNIYARDTREEDDTITTVSPNVVFESDWNRNAVELDIGADVGMYGDNDDEDFEDYHAIFRGRYDVQEKTFIFANLSYENLHEERGAPNANGNSSEPTEYDVLTAGLGFTRQLRRISLTVDGSIRELDFDDVNAIGGGIIDNDFRDRSEVNGNVRVGYEFKPNYEAFVKLGYNTRSYDQAVSSGRDSDGYDVSVGTAVDISGKTRGEVYVGYMEQSYDNSNVFKDIDGVKYGGDLLWNASALTSLRASISRSIEETVLGNASGYILTGYKVSVEHELRRNILLGANIGLTNQEYDGGTLNRDDDILQGGLEGKYLINNRFSVGASYEYTDRDSNIIGADYKKNVFMLTLNAQL